MSRVALIGYGYWGQKLARCFHELGVLAQIVDTDPEQLSKAIADYPHLDYGTMLRADVDSVAIATPPETHYDIAQSALKLGMNVFVEKPMTTSPMQAEELTDLAQEKGLSLMVGHIYLYNAGIQLMPIPTGQAELYVQLLNKEGGPSKSTREVLWAALPHAVSLALHFLGKPEEINARRSKDRIRARFDYWNGSVAYLDVGDYTGIRRRSVELRIGNTRYCFDASAPNKHTVVSGIHTQVESEPVEPLMKECQYFLNYQGVDTMGAEVVEAIIRIYNETGGAR